MDTRAARFFLRVTAYPKVVLAVSLIVIVVSGSMLSKTTRDTSSEAFIPKDHPAKVYRERVREIFGLDDPYVIAVVRDAEYGVFNPQTLELVQWLTDEAANISAIDPDRITSLATENDIAGTADGMEISPFFDYPPETQADADAVREKVMDFPLLLGSLVAEDGKATLIVCEMLRDRKDQGEQSYRDFEALLERAPVEAGEELYVAGEGAVTQFMGVYIDHDASRLQPASAFVITLILVVAYRTLRGVLIPNLVVAGAAAATLGGMAAAGVPHYVITNALPVIIIAISVADAIHILSQYYEELALNPEASQRELVVRAMVHMWRPVTFTSLTDIAGFGALGMASFMPPMRFFGLFACVGVAAALAFSMFMVPAALVVLKPKQSASFRVFARQRESGGDGFSRVMAAIGRWAMNRPRVIVGAGVLLSIAGVIGALKLEVNEERLSVFNRDEQIVRADRAICEYLDGTSYLDIVVETNEAEGLFNPDHLARIEKLQAHVEAMPGVQGTTSIIDYLKQMHRAMNEDQKEFYTLPTDSDLIAQYFFLYSATGDPTDFEEEIDYDYQLANIRATMNSGLYTNLKPVVEGAEAYIANEFNAEGIEANLAGRINVDYHWIRDLAQSHFRGVVLAFVGVFLVASLSFRSAVAGLLATMPVAMSVLAIYAVMGLTGIWLGVGTTMFAAICIGVSVDFSIHTLDRIVALVRDQGKSIDDALALLYPSTGRALLFSFAALLFGFGVLSISEVPPLRRFSFLVGVAVTISFVTSMTVLPAMVKLMNPGFLRSRKAKDV
jgi:hypothetical protein